MTASRTTSDLMREAAAAQSDGDMTRARALYDTLREREDAPRTDILANLSVMALVQGDFRAAEAHAREGLTFDPDAANTYNNLGLALKHLGRFDEAIDAFRECVARAPKHHHAWSNMATMLTRLRRLDEAVEAVAHSVALAPNDPHTVETALHAKLDACSWDGIDGVIGLCQKLVASGAAFNPYALVTFCIDPAEMLRANRNHAVTIKKTAAGLPKWVKPSQPNTGKIRVGFYSATLRDHATGYVMREMLEHYDRDRFAFHAYSYARQTDNAFTSSLQRQFDLARDFGKMSDAETVQAIRNDRLDVFIDVDGYANGGRSNITAARCAPVQVNWLGYPSSFGADYADYIIADEAVIPQSLEKFYDEAVIRLPGGYFPNDSTRPVTDRFRTRAELGLPEDAVVLCAFNQPRKITMPMVRVWAQVLELVPNTVLWLWEVNPVATANLKRIFSGLGIAENRIVLTPSMPGPDHLCRYRFADIFVDTFPCNGHTMASDALFMGVPTVTIRGRTFASRVAASMLTSLSLNDWIADDFDGYLKRIFRLAKDKELRETIRAHITKTAQDRAFFSGKRYVREFESALETITDWSRAGKPPRSFTVKPEPAPE